MEKFRKNAGKKNRNNTLDMIKLFFACMVVGVHGKLFCDISPQTGELAGHILGRSAVPFFSCVSGYFLVKAEEEGKKQVLKKHICSLLRYYIIFTAVYLIWEFINQSFAGMGAKQVSILIFKRFVFYGTYYHLWFFPCMAGALAVIHFSRRLGIMKILVAASGLAYIVSSMTYAWFGIGKTIIPGLEQMMTWFDFDYLRRFAGVILPFSVCGCVIYYSAKSRENKKRLILYWIICMVLHIQEIKFTMANGIVNGTTASFARMPMIYFTVMLALEFPLEERKKMGRFCRNTSIILYGFHPLVLEMIEKICTYRYKLPETFVCLITIAIIITISGMSELVVHKRSKTV